MLRANGFWTGCGYDLVPQRLVGNGPIRQIDGDEAIMFATANGKIKTDIVAPMFCEELRDMIEPLVLPDTPAVLSIGKRCMQMGYGFYWHPGRNPVMVTPDGNIVPVTVDKDIPYLVTGSAKSIPKKLKHFVEVPMVPAIEQEQREVSPTPTNKSRETIDNLSMDDGGPPKTQKEADMGNLRERYSYGYSGELSEEC